MLKDGAVSDVGTAAPALSGAQLAESVVDLLRARGVTVVVWDMDCTMSAAHCGSGLRRGDLPKYVGAASPDFVALTRALVSAGGFGLAVATGSDPAEYDLPGQSRETHVLGPDHNVSGQCAVITAPTSPLP